MKSEGNLNRKDTITVAYNNDIKPFSSERIEGEGNLTSDPRVISGAGKTTTVILRVAANSRSLDRNGEAVEHVEFRDIKVFGWKADAMATLSKGDRIVYAGVLEPNAYTNNEGEEIVTSQIRAHLVGAVPRTERGGGASRSRRDDADEAPARSRRSRRDDDGEAPARSRSRGRAAEADDDLDGLEDEAPARSRRSRRKASTDDGLDDHTSDLV